MNNGILKIPEVPKAIIDAVNNRTLAVFIGAGVSRLLGCNGWDILAKSLIEICHKENIITYKELNTLSQISDHKKAITISYYLLKKKGHVSYFYEEMEKALMEGDSIAIPNIYDDIKKLRGLYITTNADTHFDRLFYPENIITNPLDFQENRLVHTNLYHIHGSIKDKNTLVFTVSEYMKRYRDEQFRRFLDQIFRDFTVLFLGYGLSEFEILDFILRYNGEITRQPKHFMLSPFYKGEENILSYEQEYYNDLGITVLGYEKDEKGYKQLIDIIKCWNEEINQVTVYLHQASQIIDEAVN